jgi:glycosyltransferase involved in cell wall biosynthesis
MWFAVFTDSTTRVSMIRVGFTEAHGMVQELKQCPPCGVAYSFLEPLPMSRRWIRSPIKGYLGRYESSEHDLIEAVLSPILTSNRWIYSLACWQEAMAFSWGKCPIPRALRFAYITGLLLQENCKQVLFWSEAGKETMLSYGRVTNPELLRKSQVVYPAIREVPDEFIRFHDDEVQILFSGDFFRKGGVHVVDAFERAQQEYPEIRLRLCCDPQVDFNTHDGELRREFLDKIARNPGITMGRVSRETMIAEVLPRTDIYALPTYAEAFGFALLEAMAFGIPVISTNYLAIPEIVEDQVCGYLIDTRNQDCERIARGYVVSRLPDDFREWMTESVYQYLVKLIASSDLRKELGSAGIAIARSKFSFATRNARMLEVYQAALA